MNQPPAAFIADPDAEAGRAREDLRTTARSPAGAGRPATIGVGVSRAATADQAVAEAVAEIDAREACFVLVFVPDRLEDKAVAAALNRALPKTPAFGCTTAGQITPEGYEDEAMLILAFPRAHFRCASALTAPLRPVSIEATAREARRLADRFSHNAGWRRFAISFADGLSRQEDMLIAALSAGLGDLPIFGGSAGHGLAFDETLILHGGAFQSDAALLLIVETDLEIAALEFAHVAPTARQLVVTEARPEDRIVTEINGAPAAREYARLVGCDVADLSPQVFAENPMLVRSHDAWHVRAIQQVMGDGGLAFLSAIENGLVLTLGRGTAILETLTAELSAAGAGAANGAVAGAAPPDFILGFDCVLRRLEIEEKGLTPDASAILRAHRVLGFNTYGEQHCGVHMNQTFVGIAFFPPGRAVSP